ncbi:MAG TPA: ribosome biogenesis GTP-binding protein YihA/YsxC [Alphaproteobacteria bacterium]|nr:ribosome biogenesis GTP-binding protein YihA/YsxC [Alphaproteobacteria bacterium]
MNGNPDIDDEEIEAARKLFAGPCDFVAGAMTADQLPAPDLVEVAFAGRSNVGKSSLINALTGRKALARTSSKPGRTQQINFFNLGGRLTLVDLPGFGYAQASKGRISAWTNLVMLYLKGRPSLRRVMLLIDCRRGIGEGDREVMADLDAAAVSYQIVLTKCDRAEAEVLERLREEIAAETARHPAAHPEVISTSAQAGSGIAQLRAAVAALAEKAPSPR